MAELRPVLEYLLVIADLCRGQRNAFLEKGTVEGAHGAIDGRAEHGGLGGFIHGLFGWVWVTLFRTGQSHGCFIDYRVKYLGDSCGMYEASNSVLVQEQCDCR